MSKALLAVSSNPATPEQAEEFNAWYNDVHAPQMIERVAGFTSCTRYVVSEASPTEPALKYLALYEIETDDPAASMAALNEALAGGKLDLSASLSPDATLTLYTAL